MSDKANELAERLFDACVGSCTCALKTIEVKVHLPDCHYRLFSEAFAELTRLAEVERTAVEVYETFRISPSVVWDELGAALGAKDKGER